MKQLLLDNCIDMDTVLFDLDNSPYTVNMLLSLLKAQGTTKNVKKKMTQYFGKKFKAEDREKVITYLKGVAHSILGTGEDAVKELEEQTGAILIQLKTQVDNAEDTGNFEDLAQQLPNIGTIVGIYTKLGGYFQTCADFLEQAVRIQNGLGEHKTAQLTQKALDSYQKKAGI
ncbi:hypothetical protein [Desulfosporosinus meridiei]|uniref:Uncharacterized protein n=1 Tax=Desulfosporosinus meridiei (strain ATCC BAA-275 / DSM 13257 / KCTC 12902 / NCIMB 13706 / S10) TaxID=768704 RepID=J7ISW9_DESMD|nr:hypothetical protein [Desulfosporosinus meridiei]AFQ43274.1 hypothetical protein Desmer_1259 [Desulfosporosinus meridiei DSM 13257]